MSAKNFAYGGHNNATRAAATLNFMKRSTDHQTFSSVHLLSSAQPPQQYVVDSNQTKSTESLHHTDGLDTQNQNTITTQSRLHWLPVKQWVVFKLAIIVFQSLRGETPS